ncbi:MAG: hypothetical protein ABSF98_15595 [Bryobacteraceae bacterium]|jgi:hypothetical protein
MPSQNTDTADDVDNLRETHQPDVPLTYSPPLNSGNYHPTGALSPTPPTGGSGVPSGRNATGALVAPVPSGGNSSST